MNTSKRSARRALALYMNGERVGTWRMVRGTGEELEYAESWMHSPNGRPISLRFPFVPGKAKYSGPAVHYYFDNLLPDANNIRERLAQRFRTGSVEAFALLREMGRDCVGALQILAEDDPPPSIETLTATRVNERAIAALLRNATLPATGIARTDRDDFRISIAGAQEKTALLRHGGHWNIPTGPTATTHIFKLPLGLVANGQVDMSTSVQNEWLCAKLLAAYGLSVAECAMAQFEDQQTLIVKRFDRRPSQDGRWIVRLPQEDFCQVTGTPYYEKYQTKGGPGIDAILEILRNSANAAEDRVAFLKCQIIFWLLAATDGHAKNFSIRIEPGGAYSLTPFYDVLSVYPVMGKKAGQLSPMKVSLAMGVRGEQNMHYKLGEVQRRHWIATGKRNGLGEQITGIIDGLIASTPGVIEQVRAQLPAVFPEHISESIFAGMKKAAKTLASQT